MRSLQVKFSALVVTLLVMASISLALIATKHERGALEDEVRRRAKAFGDGGWIYHSDHSVPPTMKYRSFTNLLGILRNETKDQL